MKKILLGGIILFMCFSCTSSYEKAIGDWLQTDSEGTWTDMKFKLIEIVETQDITVADSVRVLKKYFEKDKELKLDSFKSAFNRAIMMGFINRYNYSAAESEYKKEYETLKKQLDSVSFSSPYNNRDTTEVLVKLMTCKYSIVSPRMNVQQKKTEMFMLTPDMKKCIARMVKSKSK